MVGMAPWSSAYEPFTNRETLERRRGAKIKGRGIYRDAVRSSRSQLVKASGLRWISLMWLGHVPWAGRHWALPVLTVLAPSTRYYQQQGRRHKKLTDWARQMIMQLRRWLPQRPLVLVGDNSYAVLDLLHCCQSLREPVTLIARLRLDAALYAPAPARQPGQNGRPPLKGARRPALKTILDQQKKAALEGESRRYSRMLSSFSYGKIKAYFISRGYRQGVEVHQVNPVYSSVIGRVKFMERYGLSVHQAAGLVLARRLLGCSERIPRRWVCPIGNGVQVAFTVPVRKRVKHVWRYWGAVSGQLRPALAAQHRLGKRRRGPNPVQAVVRGQTRGVA